MDNRSITHTRLYVLYGFHSKIQKKDYVCRIEKGCCRNNKEII